MKQSMGQSKSCVWRTWQAAGLEAEFGVCREFRENVSNEGVMEKHRDAVF